MGVLNSKSVLWEGTVTIPVVSKQTRDEVLHEFESYGNGGVYCGAMCKRLDSTENGGDGLNPIIAQFFFDILQMFEDKRLAGHMIALGLMVYRAIEKTVGTEKMPKIDEHIGAPIQQEYMKDPQKYSQTLAVRLMHQNRNVPLLCIDLCGLLAMSDDPMEQKIPTMAMSTGCIVYRFIESQIEADEMTKSFVPAS